jgi:Domain of unknown function (DUF222)/HNH endonuclease
MAYEQVYALVMSEAAIKDLEARIADICGYVNVAAAELVDAVAEALAGELWSQWGIRSAEQWVAWKTGCSPSSAKQMVAAARRSVEFPKVMQAFRNGELSFDQVATVMAKAPARIDDEIVDMAKAMTVTQLRTALGRYPLEDRKPAPPSKTSPDSNAAASPAESGSEAADADSSDPADEPAVASPPSPASSPSTGEPADNPDAASFFTGDDGVFQFHLRTSAEQGALIERAISEARDALFNAGQSDVTWLDAFIEVCSRSLAATGVARRDSHRIYMHLATDSPAGPQAWLNAGVNLPGFIRDQMCCDGHIQPLFTANGLPVNLGRSFRIVPERTRRLVLDRDRTCRHPGCNRVAHLDIHHIVTWLMGGATDLDNLVALCPKHHRAYHRGDYSIVGSPVTVDGLRFYDARGRPIEPVGRPSPPGDCPRPAPPPGHFYDHPDGGRVDYQQIFFTSPKPSP